MKILIADDDPSMLKLIGALLVPMHCEAIKVTDGDAAWQVLSSEKEPMVAILDWNMPGAKGIELCRRLSINASASPHFVILLTAKNDKKSTIEGLEAGADDYIIKPFDLDELRARVRTGVRMVNLRQALAERVRALEEALANNKRLKSLLPMCAWCRKIRNDKDYWQALESYVLENTDTKISHGICPECKEREFKKRVI